ncbi:MAG: hypothetical protein HZA54_07295 [Planctomycetes bacterium]|nr:hypothetical protein [Planctomycetota bacterium]
MVVAVATTLGVMNASLRTLDGGVAANVLDARARRLVEQVAQELRQAGAATLVPPNPNASTTLAFQQNAGYVAGAVTWGPLTSYSLIAMPSGLGMPPLFECRRTSGTQAISLGGDIAPNGLAFTLTPAGLTITVTLQRTLPTGETITRTSATTVTLRN